MSSVGPLAFTVLCSIFPTEERRWQELHPRPLCFEQMLRKETLLLSSVCPWLCRSLTKRKEMGDLRAGVFFLQVYLTSATRFHWQPSSTVSTKKVIEERMLSEGVSTKHILALFLSQEVSLETKYGITFRMKPLLPLELGDLFVQLIQRSVTQDQVVSFVFLTSFLVFPFVLNFY